MLVPNVFVFSNLVAIHQMFRLSDSILIRLDQGFPQPPTSLLQARAVSEFQRCKRSEKFRFIEWVGVHFCNHLNGALYISCT